MAALLGVRRMQTRRRTRRRGGCGSPRGISGRLGRKALPLKKDRRDLTVGKIPPCKTRIKFKINGPKESQAPNFDPKHEDVDEDTPMGNTLDLRFETQQGLANLPNQFFANTSKSSRRIKLKINGPKEKGASISCPKHECSDENTLKRNAPDLAREIVQQKSANISSEVFADTPKSGRMIKLKINGPREKGVSISSPEHKYAGGHTPMGNAPGLPCAVVQQKSANISGEVITDTPKSSRSACRPGSLTLSPRRGSAFIDTSTYYGASIRSKILDVSLVSPTRQPSSDLSRNSLSLTIGVSNATGGGNSASASQPLAATPGDTSYSNQSDSVNHQSRLEQPAAFQTRRLGGDSDSENEDDKNRKKSPLESCHDVSDVSSDDSKKRKRRASTKRGKMAIEQGDPDSWLLGVPSPFAANEIDDATAQARIRPPVFIYSFGTSSQNVDDSDDASGAASNVACASASGSTSNIPSNDPSQITAKMPDSSNARDPQNSEDKLERPRRKSLVDSFLKQDRHPREGTKFPNMAIQGYARACGMPTSAQFAGQRYKIPDREGNKVVMNPIPIPPKISERSNLTPRDTSFPGPSRKQLLNKVSKTCDGVDSSCTGELQERCDADGESSPSRGRMISSGPPNVSREESEGRPGWRNTVLVPAHVITGEETRHAPWVADARPHELERDGIDREAGYRASLLSLDSIDQEEGYKSSSLPTDSSSDIDSTTVEEDISQVHEAEEMSDAPPSVRATEERADAPSLVQGTEQTARVVLVQRTAQSAKVVLVQAAEPNRSAQQIREDTEPISDVEDLVDDSSSRRNLSQISETDEAIAAPSENTIEIPIRQFVNNSRIIHGGTGYHVEHARSVPISEGPPAILMTYSQGGAGRWARNDPRPRQASTSSNESSAGCNCCIIEAFKCIMCGLPQRQIQTPQNPRHPPLRPAGTEPLPSVPWAGPTHDTSSNGNNPRPRCQTASREADWRDSSTGTATANATPQNRTNEASVETLELQEVEASTSGQPGNCTSSNAQKDVSSSRQASLDHAGSR